MYNKILADITQNKNFLMIFACAIFMCGILACFYNHAVVTAVIVTILVIVLLYIKIFNIKQVLIFSLIFYSGFFLTFCKTKNYDELLQLAPSQIELTGRIVSVPKYTDYNKIKFFFQVEKVGSEKVDSKTFVTVARAEDENIHLKYNLGERITFQGKLRKPFTSTNPSQFDYSAYLKNFNVFTTVYVDSNDIKVIENSKKSLKWNFLNKLDQTRNKIVLIHSKYLKSPNLEILGGIVFGDDAISPPEYIKNSFVNSGLLHILAASGMNVAFIYLFLYHILRFLKFPYRARILLGMFAVILYTLMTGLGASVVRAALMLLFILVGKLIDRDANSVSLLGFVAVLMLIYNPAYINDVSFQLSFLVTLGLLTTLNVISSKLEKVPSYLKDPILIPIIAQIWVAPIQMFYFNTFSLYSIFANISAASLLSIISFGGFVSSTLAIIPSISDFVCRIFDFILKYLLDALVYISNFFAGMKYCLLQTTHPDLYQIVLYYAMIVGATFLVKQNKFKNALITVFSISCLLAFTNIRPISKDLEIIAFDVQNADSFLIKTPQNKYFMIDTGKAPYDSGNSQANIIMLKYLKDRGIKNLEGVIVTHFDNDHSGGAVDIVSKTKTKTLYLNSRSVDTQTGKNIYKTIEQIGQNYNIAQNNKEIYKEKDFSIKTYMANIKGKDESNGCSIITLVSYKDFDMLFMGDAGIESFNQVKKDIPTDVEVLKVGHHGGPKVVDEEMIKHLNTKVSVISTGINYFGHPNKGSLDILRNTDVYRTDFNHSIKIDTNGKTYKVSTYDPGNKKYVLAQKYD